MKYYYLINGKIMSANEKMPVINEQWHTYNSNLLKWSESLQPCEISESELEKIKYQVFLTTNEKASNPIEVTDIVEEDWNGHCIIFKHPKQVEKIEAVEFHKWIINNCTLDDYDEDVSDTSGMYSINKEPLKYYTVEQLYNLGLWK